PPRRVAQVLVIKIDVQQPQRLPQVMLELLAVDGRARIGQQSRLVQQQVGVVQGDEICGLHALHSILRREAVQDLPPVCAAQVGARSRGVFAPPDKRLPTAR